MPAIPKRSDQRAGHRSKADLEAVTKLEVDVLAEPPPLGWEPGHFLVRDLYESAKVSAQAVFYEPTDWAVLRLLLFQADVYLQNVAAGGRISSHALAQIVDGFSTLMFTEGDRRRLRLEITRKAAAPVEDASVTALAGYRAALGV